MLHNILLAIVQAATEFLPISSSGHLALLSNFMKGQDLFFFTTLHIASLFAVLIFTRKEIFDLLSFKKEFRLMWLYLILATIPAAGVGFFYKNVVERSFSSMIFLGCAFIFTGIVLFLTRFTKTGTKLSVKKAIIIGLAQTVALFPGVSRSAMTISSALFLGVERERAVKFSFLLFIPLSLGAGLLELGEGAYFNVALVISFFICLALSVLFLKLLYVIVKKEKFWIFSFYCIFIGLVTLYNR